MEVNENSEWRINMKRKKRRCQKSEANGNLQCVCVHMCVELCCVSGFLWPPWATVPLLPWKPRKWVNMGHTLLRAIKSPDVSHAMLWTTHTHIHTRQTDTHTFTTLRVNRLIVSIIYHFFSPIILFSHLPAANMNTHLHTHKMTLLHTHTPTEVAWIITFSRRLLGNSKPTCQSVCVSVCASISLWNQAKLMERTLFPSQSWDSVQTETGSWPKGQSNLQGVDKQDVTGRNRKCTTLTSCPLCDLWRCMMGRDKA